MMDECVAVTVEWVDSAAPEGSVWWKVDDYDLEPGRIVTRGWLIVDEEDYVVVASSLSVNAGAVAGLITIPRGCITQLTPED